MAGPSDTLLNHLDPPEIRPWIGDYIKTCLSFEDVTRFQKTVQFDSQKVVSEMFFFKSMQGCMARGGHALPKVLLEPAMPDPSMPCRQATPETVLEPF
jgi:hypothetical protein